MKFILISLLLFCSECLCIRDLLQPLLTLDKSQRFRSKEPVDTCFLYVDECDLTYKYRSFDGSCNNLKHPTWGLANSAFTRIFPASYSDGKVLPPRATDGSELPNARYLVTELFDNQNVPDEVSLAAAAFSQFVAHDTASSVFKTGVDDCCSSDDRLTCISVYIPQDDLFYSQYNITCLEMTRAETTLTGSCLPNGPQQQTNGVSHSLDGSQIYGSDKETADSLRVHESGRLLIRQRPDGTCFLPSDGTCYNSTVCYAAGDNRVNQNTDLSITQTLFVRQHNKVAELLSERHPEWNDETLYQEARRIIVALYQHIVYNEFLPIYFSTEYLTRVKLRSSNAAFEYDEEVPNIVISSFSSAIYRIFHSGIQGLLRLYSSHANSINYIDLTDYMNSPEVLEENNNFDALLLGSLLQPMQQLDEHYPAQVTEQLFHYGNPYGQDLTSLDIQRGRDYGTPSYMTVLYGCTGIVVKTFDDLADLWTPEKIERVQKVYKSVEDIDLFVGINLEKKLPGHKLSPVSECVIGEQFYRWKHGDRFWYEIQEQLHSFSLDQLEEIRKITLSHIICDTCDNITRVNLHAFFTPAENNPIVSCDDLQKIDFQKF